MTLNNYENKINILFYNLNFSEAMDRQKSDNENSESEDEMELQQSGLMVTKEDAERNYQLAGTLVDEPPDEINFAKHGHLLKDTVHALILEVLQEKEIKFKLADFQMLSLHVLGSKKNLILISPTGSGKMLGKSSLIKNISAFYNLKVSK